MAICNRLAVFLIGAALAAVGVIVAVEAVWTGSNSGFVWFRGGDWLDYLRTTAWSAHGVMVVSVAVAVAGAVLLVVEIWPRRSRLLLCQADRPDGADWMVQRRSAEGHLRRRLEKQLPVPVKTRLTGRGDRWRLRVTAAAAPAAVVEIEEAARAELARLGATQATVRVRTVKPKQVA